MTEWPRERRRREIIVCIRVLIADDQPRARRSLKALLTATRWSIPDHGEEPTPAGCLPLEIVGEAENGREAIEQVWALHPDVVVMDLHPQHAAQAVPALEPRPDSAAPSGADAIQMIKSGWPAIRIVVLTMFATDRASVLGAGADVFLLKGCPTSELLEAVMPRGLADPG
jgi:DNA-binding NarL/FixJ family response regulator